VARERSRVRASHESFLFANLQLILTLNAELNVGFFFALAAVVLEKTLDTKL
jgi:predicted ABC-type transport system involved in lysophospholipase L1 biosynthesis ATPase subunit